MPAWSGDCPLPGPRVCVLTQKRARELSGVPLIRVRIPFMGGGVLPYDLSISLRPPPPNTIPLQIRGLTYDLVGDTVSPQQGLTSMVQLANAAASWIKYGWSVPTERVSAPSRRPLPTPPLDAQSSSSSFHHRRPASLVLEPYVHDIMCVSPLPLGVTVGPPCCSPRLGVCFFTSRYESVRSTLTDMSAVSRSGLCGPSCPSVGFLQEIHFNLLYYIRYLLSCILSHYTI